MGARCGIPPSAGDGFIKDGPRSAKHEQEQPGYQEMRAGQPHQSSHVMVSSWNSILVYCLTFRFAPDRIQVWIFL